MAKAKRAHDLRILKLLMVILIVILSEVHPLRGHPLAGNPDRPPTDQDYTIDGCPVESYNGVIVSSKANLTNFIKSGEMLHFHCSSGLVYPHATRICQPNGTYGGVKPTCTLTPDEFRTSQEKHTAEIPFRGEECPGSSYCEKARKHWTPIGQLNGCSLTDIPSSSQKSHQKVILVKFHQHIYTSVMTFSPYDASGRRIVGNVIVLIPHGYSITSLSENAQTMHKTFFDAIHLRKGKHELCAVTEIAAHTKELLIVFTVTERADNWQHNVKFFPVPQWNAKHSMTDSEEPQCPERPHSIPHGRVVNANVLSDPSSFTIECDEGYVLVDPITKSTVEKVECKNNLEWSHYHLPVCVSKRDFFDTQNFERQYESRFSSSRSLRSKTTSAAPPRPVTTQHSEEDDDTPVNDFPWTFFPIILLVIIIFLFGTLGYCFFKKSCPKSLQEQEALIVKSLPIKNKLALGTDGVGNENLTSGHQSVEHV